MAASSPLFLGLDVGTQSVRAALFDDTGECAGFATSSLDTFHPQAAWAEQGTESNRTQEVRPSAMRDHGPYPKHGRNQELQTLSIRAFTKFLPPSEFVMRLATMRIVSSRRVMSVSLDSAIPISLSWSRRSSNGLDSDAVC